MSKRLLGAGVIVWLLILGAIGYGTRGLWEDALFPPEFTATSEPTSIPTSVPDATPLPSLDRTPLQPDDYVAIENAQGINEKTGHELEIFYFGECQGQWYGMVEPESFCMGIIRHVNPPISEDVMELHNFAMTTLFTVLSHNHEYERVYVFFASDEPAIEKGPIPQLVGVYRVLITAPQGRSTGSMTGNAIVANWGWDALKVPDWLLNPE